MARKGKGRKGKRKRYLQVNIGNSTNALGGGDVTSTAQGNTVADRVFALWAKGVWTYAGNTAGDGPLMVGLAHSDYTAAEIEECLEAGASWDEGDLVAAEQARRKVRRVGTFDGLLTDEKLANGQEVFTKLGFVIADGDTIQSWARNTDAAQRGANGSVNFNGIICVVPA